MGAIISIITILASIVLILVVLVQNSKGGGLSSNFSSSNQIMGAPKTADFLEKTTWALAGTIIVLSMLSSKYMSYTANENNGIPSITIPASNTQAPDMQSPVPTVTPEFPVPATSSEAPKN